MGGDVSQERGLGRGLGRMGGRGEGQVGGSGMWRWLVLVLRANGNSDDQTVILSFWTPHSVVAIVENWQMLLIKALLHKEQVLGVA